MPVVRARGRERRGRQRPDGVENRREERLASPTDVIVGIGTVHVDVIGQGKHLVHVVEHDEAFSTPLRPVEGV